MNREEKNELLATLRQERLYEEAAKIGPLARAPAPTFGTPWIVHHSRRCRDCRAYWRIDCCNGAEAPVRDPFWRCCDCRYPRAIPALPNGAALMERDRQPQLVLAPSDDAATIEDQTDTWNEKSRHEAGSRKPFGEDGREPIEPVGHLQEEVG